MCIDEVLENLRSIDVCRYSSQFPGTKKKRVGRCGPPIFAVFFRVFSEILHESLGMATWGHPDHKSPFPSKSSPGLVFCTMVGGTLQPSLQGKTGRIQNMGIPFPSLSGKIGEDFPLFFKIRSGKSGEDFPRLLPRMQKTPYNGGIERILLHSFQRKKVADGVMFLVSHPSRATMPRGHWEDSLLPSSQRKA